MTKTRFTTPVGRFVQGDLDTPQDKDAQGNPRVVKTGPNAGQPNPQFFMALAIAKNDPAWPAFWNTVCQAAAAGFPNLFPNAAAGDYTCVHPGFAFKVVDGDGVDTMGKSNATKEGFAGHWVVRFASSYPPRLFHKDRYAPSEQIQEKGAIKRGYYCRVSGTVEGNGQAQKPGVYLNLDMVELTAYGQEIISGPAAGEAFGGANAAPVALPPGATAAPVTPMPSAGPGAPPPAGPTPAAPAPVAPGAAPSPAAASPVPGSPPAQPYAGYMAGPTPAAAPAAPAASPAPPVPGAPPLPTAPAGKVMLPAAQGATYEQLIAAGWTDATLVQHGMMQA